MTRWIGGLIPLLVMGCASMRTYAEAADRVHPSVAKEEPAPANPTGGEGQEGKTASWDHDAVADAANSVVPVAPVRRASMIIYAADLTLAVFDVSPKIADVESLARGAGGFLVKRDDTSIVIRVPVAKFDEVVQATLKLGDVVHHGVTATDVTEEYSDLDVQVRNLRAERDRLEQLLGKAATAQEAVLVEKELSRVTGELERIEGRMKFLRDRAAYSTITVRFEARREETSPKTVRLPFPWLDELGLGHLLSLH